LLADMATAKEGSRRSDEQQQPRQQQQQQQRRRWRAMAGEGDGGGTDACCAADLCRDTRPEHAAAELRLGGADAHSAVSQRCSHRLPAHCRRPDRSLYPQIVAPLRRKRAEDKTVDQLKQALRDAMLPTNGIRSMLVHLLIHVH
jgi:hypothetical protein